MRKITEILPELIMLVFLLAVIVRIYVVPWFYPDMAIITWNGVSCVQELQQK